MNFPQCPEMTVDVVSVGGGILTMAEVPTVTYKRNKYTKINHRGCIKFVLRSIFQEIRFLVTGYISKFLTRFDLFFSCSNLDSACLY